MDEATYELWWPLHLRVAKGETLSPEQQGMYEAGLGQLHREEVLTQDLGELRELRKAVGALEEEHASLDAEHSRLQSEISALEAALTENARELVGVGS